jgi:uncharacterized BrkB/YihY/UPF0761 family membrane protein
MENKPPLDLRESYFSSLREEILNTRARIFRALLVGIIGAPILTYFALREDTHVMVLMLAPFMVLMVLVLYLSEQASMMQAGRFIKEKVEQDEGDWEHWLSARRAHDPEPQLFSTFAFLCVIFYVILVCFALQRVAQMKALDNPQGFDLYMHEFWRFGMPLLYIIATFWVLFTLLHFWRSALKT